VLVVSPDVIFEASGWRKPQSGDEVSSLTRSFLRHRGAGMRQGKRPPASSAL